METLQVGQVVREGLRIWLRNFIPFTLVSIAIYTPAVILWLLLPGKTWYVVVALLAVFLNAVIGSSLTYAVVMEVRGTRPAFRDCISVGGARALVVIGVVLMTMLTIGGALLLLVVPGIVVACMLYVAVPVAIVENTGVIEALSRSRQLTDGHKVTIMGISIVTLLVNWGISEIAKAVFGDGTRAIMVIGVNVLTGALTAVVAAVAYTHLRHIKDGTKVLDLAPAVATIRPPG